MTPVRAQVIVLAGPSGAGKSHLAERVGLPVLRLDDFYKDGDDPTLPRIDLAGGEPIVDWDSPESWNAEAAVAAVEELCRTGTHRRPGLRHREKLADGTPRARPGRSAYFVAEGIFAAGGRRRVPAAQAARGRRLRHASTRP